MLVNPGVALPNAVAPFSPVKVVEASLPQEPVQTLFDPVEKTIEVPPKQPRGQTQLEDRFRDRVTLSQRSLGQADDGSSESVTGDTSDESVQASPPSSANESQVSQEAQGLTDAELLELAELAQRDREVRNHEQAHAAVGGRYAGAPSFSFTRGPDGQQYATGGEVSIDVSPVSGDPEATIRKMEVVQRAATAPAEPSSQDRRVAAEASRLELDARAELTELEAEKNRVEQEARAQRREEARAAADAKEAEEAQDESDQSAKERFEEISRSTNSVNNTLIGFTSIDDEITLGNLLDLKV